MAKKKPKKSKRPKRKSIFPKKVKRKYSTNPYKSERKRDWDNAEYRKFRRLVRARDYSTCQLCGAKKRIQVHHILRYHDFPQHRYNVDNGICLCETCHRMVNRVEHLYVQTFTEIVQRNKRRQNGG